MRFRLALFLVLSMAAVGIGFRELHAQQPLPPHCVVSVPLDWGQFKGISKYGLVFEDSNGTLRIIEQMPCSIDPGLSGIPNIAVEVRRK